MAVNEKVRELLPDGAIIFEQAAYDNSILGTTLNGRVIYSFELMIKELQNDNQFSEDEAMEWISYNTLRALPYMGDKAPLIVYYNGEIQF